MQRDVRARSGERTGGDAGQRRGRPQPQLLPTVTGGPFEDDTVGNGHDRAGPSRSVIETSSPRPPWASGRYVLVEELEERGAERLTAGALVVDDVTGSVDHDDVHGG